MRLSRWFDWADLCLLLGLVLLGWSAYMLLGLAALLAYAGTVLVIVSGVAAYRQGRRSP
jgi:hypothetical protein